MADILCHYCKHDIREHHRNLGCFGDDEECSCGLDEVTVAKVGLDAANAKLDAALRVARWVTDGDPYSDAQMIVDLIDGRCIGTPFCPAPTHEHGCFADRGNCDDPDDHPKEDQ